MRRAELANLGDGGGDRRDPGTIHQEGSPGPQVGGVRYCPGLKSDGGKARGPDGGNQGRLVERASPHLTSEECRQLQAAMAARKHLFAKGKGDLGRTDIVQHQIHTGDQPAIKQRVRRYPAARREEERQLVEDMLAIVIIQESNSAWSSPTILVKKKDGTTRFCIDYR